MPFLHNELFVDNNFVLDCENKTRSYTNATTNEINNFNAKIANNISSDIYKIVEEIPEIQNIQTENAGN